ncbi:uncharacterized protein CTRU02_211384 [Colletotrichum truncatum]|uniref:Uncharacterized protein n=1 Tax=Colletotrichum truncatum TaxID=5467 RepID=A0ACC3YRN3_COLTU|nr:uncharacterized protein CTRU02_02161 [Colletotrichum truncatum]KAF6799290.1 hypothetical protein CTRU02_02161 [Colletotrichum truncatum]
MVQVLWSAALALSGLSIARGISAEIVSAQVPAAEEGSAKPAFTASSHHARENAAHIFNAVHSAMRQWGSSLRHNGLGLIPATVPEGTLLYHGTRSNSTPKGFEWLAFEMEHSEGFARSWKGGFGTPPPKKPGKGSGKGPGGEHPPPPPSSQHVVAVEDEQRVLSGDNDDDGRGGSSFDDDGDGPRPMRGYFHTYRANRDLKLLYLDGMSAGKTAMGTLDTQDFLLRGVGNASWFGEWERAAGVCEIVKAWGFDGVIRMEIGFESIYCDFFDGLDLVSALRRPWNTQFEGRGDIDMFEWARAVGQRYDGIGGGRVKLDFSRMVSGLWYPLNVSNPNGRKDMPRLGRLKEEEREAIVGRVEDVARQGGRGSKVDWQGLVDMIVTRHGDRIEALADEPGDEDEAFVRQVLVVTNTFIDYPRDEFDSASVMGEDGLVRESRERCVRHYLTPAKIWEDEWTPEEGLIFTAVETVVRRICGDLYAVRGIILDAAPELAAAFSETEIRAAVGDADDGKIGEAVARGRKVVQALKSDLGWSMWKKCKPGCGVAEVCFVAMWPFGTEEDHYHPSCKNRTSLGGRPAGKKSYWRFDSGFF